MAKLELGSIKAIAQATAKISKCVKLFQDNT